MYQTITATEIGKALPPPQLHHTAVIYGDSLFILGGINYSIPLDSTFYEYNLRKTSISTQLMINQLRKNGANLLDFPYAPNT
jgi:hypothetical protein